VQVKSKFANKLILRLIYRHLNYFIIMH